MCGISGILNFSGRPVGEEVMRKMASALRHRGPDDEGFYFSKGLGFGFRRLSIIDLSTGHQPIHNEDRSVWVMLNGEIYDFAALRQSLERKGHRFSTRSDTEVIVHLYEEHGERFLEYLNGMFSLALWDNRNDLLILARDRMGKKPLHYCLLADKLLFASEIKALLRHPDCPRDLDLLSLAKYLHFEYVPAPSTIFEGIRKLRPAEYLLCRNNRVTVSSYWDIPYTLPKNTAPIGTQAGELRALLEESVKKRLVSDVPLGVFLSGGIDSSAVAALMARSSSGKVRSFNISFSEEDFDEAPDARRVASFLGTEHHEEVFSPETLPGLLPQVADFLDEPLADPSLLPTYLLSRFTRSSVTVALGGDGGDELFAGYPTYLAHRYYGLYAGLPEAIRKAARFAAQRMPVSTGYFSLDFKAKRFLRGEGCALAERHARWMSAFLPEELPLLLTPDVLASLRLKELYAELEPYDRPEIKDPVERAMYLDAKMYLQDDVLTKVDRASMAVSLEVRAPFLDRSVVEFAARLPLDRKLNGLTSKFVLRKAVAGLLPPEVIRKKKQGFSLPLSRWFRGELAPLLDRYLDAGRLKEEGIFRPEYVRRLIEEHRSGRHEHRKTLWSLLVFELWREHYGRR